MAETQYEFTEDARLAVFQARHEALALGAAELLPAHLALGVIKTLTRFQRAACFTRPEEFARLCHALGAAPEPAPLIPEEIGYSAEATAVMAGAIHAAAQEGEGAQVSPVHLLLGIHAPCGLEDYAPRPASRTATVLADAGLDPHHVRVFLAWRPPVQPRW